MRGNGGKWEKTRGKWEEMVERGENIEGKRIKCEKKWENGHRDVKSLNVCVQVRTYSLNTFIPSTQAF